MLCGTESVFDSAVGVGLTLAVFLLAMTFGVAIIVDEVWGYWNKRQIC